MNFKFFKSNFSHIKTNRVLRFLIGMDILFILAHVVLTYLVFIRIDFDWSIAPFMVERDGSYPEIFQYLKYFAVIVAIIYILYKKKEIGYLSWLFVFILLLLDDALLFHERFGAWVMEKFNYTPMLGLRAQDLGELTYVAVFGLIIMFFLLFGYYKGNKTYRKTNIDIGILFALFLFFGIAIDMLHQFFDENRWSNLIIILIEDGGEMITLSLITWYFMYLTVRPDNHNSYLSQYFYKKN